MLKVCPKQVTVEIYIQGWISALRGPWANSIWGGGGGGGGGGFSSMFTPPPPMSIKCFIFVDNGDPSSLGATGLQPILAHM